MTRIVVLFLCVLLALTALAPAASAADAKAPVLAAPGHRTALVIRDDWKQAVWSDWGGYQILAAFAKEVTGAEVPTIKASEAAAPDIRSKYDTLVWVGRQPEVDRVLGAELDKLDDDGFIIRAVNGDVYLAGKKWWGDNWAAHDLLERFAGCRWYGPEKQFWTPEQGIVGLFDVIPKKDRIELPADTNVVEQPSYKMRWFRFMPLHAFRLRYRDQFHHALGGIIVPQRHGKDHPEWFPLIDGKRLIPPPGEEHTFQPCVSNEGVLDEVANAAIEAFKKNPDVSSYSVGMNDTGNFCECEQCLAIAPPQIADKQQRLAYAFFDFYNRVAQKVEAAGFGDKRLGCLGYAGLSVLPKGSIKMHPMLVPYLTRDSSALFDPAQQAEFTDIVGTWSGLSHRMGIYEYLYGGGFVVPRIYNRYLIKNVQEQYGVGVDGLYAESYPNWGLDGPKYWLLAKMLWNHRQDPSALLDAYYTDLFGPAAGTMRGYFDFLEETWCTQSLKSENSNYRWFLQAKQLEIFPPATCDKAWAMLEAAAQQTNDPLVLKRIEYFRDAFAVTRALSQRYAASTAIDRTLEETAKAAPRDALAARLAALQQWLDAPDPRPILERALAHPGALDDTVIRNNGGFEKFDRQPTEAVARLVADLAAGAIDNHGDRSPAAVRRRIAEAFAGAAPKPAADYLSDLAARAGTLTVSAAPAAALPTIDGKIGESEWPTAPAFAGRFHEMLRLTRQPEQTTIRAAWSGDQLFLAFDLKQDPSTVGATATGTDTGGWQQPAMINDDCVSVTFQGPGSAFRSVRVNVNGAVGFHDANWDGVVKAAAATKTEDGWQAELALDLNVLGLTDKEKGQWSAAVARYTRRPLPPADPNAATAAPPQYRAEATALAPAPPGGGVIGRGNHPGLMTFVSGPRLLFEPAR